VDGLDADLLESSEEVLAEFSACARNRMQTGTLTSATSIGFLMSWDRRSCAMLEVV
jgi:hypothetical protein